MKTLEELTEDFLSTITPKTLDNITFYEKLINYLDTSTYDISLTESDIERHVFGVAKDRGYLGYEVILSIKNMEEFSKTISSYLLRQDKYFYHFAYEDPEEVEMCFSDVWDKWNNNPPMGWIGGYCQCGHFFPYTLDISMTEMKGHNDNLSSKYTPRKIALDEIKSVDFCSDNNMRFLLKDDTVVLAKPFKLDKGLIFNFSIDPMGILK